jgi:hypothetical protein
MPLFPRWSNRVARFIGAFALLAPVFAVGGGLILSRTSFATQHGSAVAQGSTFDHSKHAQLDCRYCHTSVENAASAGMPSMERCNGCHAHAGTALPKALAWSRMNALPDFVFFDHSAHAAKGVGCATCHAAGETMTMQTCIECHRSANTQPDVHARTSCDACHR